MDGAKLVTVAQRTTRVKTAATSDPAKISPIGESFFTRIVRWSTASIASAAFVCLSRAIGVCSAAVTLWSLPLAATAQISNSEALVDLMAKPGGAGAGVLFSSERSPYKGAGQRSDVQPVYLYEGERFFLRSDRAGIKFAPVEDQELDLYLRHRVAGYPLDDPPPSLEGLATHAGGTDLGLTWRLRFGESQAYASLYQNINNPHGQELDVGAFTDWVSGAWTLRPAAWLTWRSSRVNNFYFGVPPEAATPERPSYQPGAGVDASAGLYVSYQLTEGWRLVGGVSATRYSSAVRASPIVESGTQVGATLGATYSLGADEVRKTAASSPTWVRVLYGQAVEDRCDIIDIMVLRCTSIDQAAPTEIYGFSLGKTLLENLNGWPLDFVGYINVILHHDRPFQKNGLELDVFLKAFYRGFPWSDRVLTRLGFGWGLSWSDPVPQAENSEQASRNRRTSRLLNYIEPSIDISLGDVFSKPDWKQTFLGLSITHRSGMFGNSQMLGRVDGGSNYLTVYAEHPF